MPTNNSWILPVITFSPLLGALVIMFIPGARDRAIKLISLVWSLIPLALSVWLWFAYSAAGPQFPDGSQFGINVPWIPALGVSFAMGVDGLSVPLIFLTTLLTTLSLIYSLFIETRSKEYFWMFLLLETGMLGVFTALDFVLFFVFWEVSLVPMYFLIGIWGGPRREYAAIKFFLYTMVGSMAMLLAILAMYFSPEVSRLAGGHTFDMMLIAKAHPFAANATVAALVFWGLFFGFAIKVPMFPFHTWLPDAHVEAPTAGSVILAGVLLKMGTYGFMRVLMPMMPDQFARFWWIIALVSLVAIIYGALVAMAQTDLKKLIAYSSVNHMGYVTLGCAVAGATSVHGLSEASRMMALNGAQMQVFSHGLITGALFLLVGVIYERAHTRDLSSFGGLGARLPVFAGMLAFCSFASLGLPGMTGFIAELSVLVGTFAASPLLAGLALIGLVVTAAYMLWMLQRVLLGPLNPKYAELPDANAREIVSLAPLMALMLLFGVLPGPLMAIFDSASRVIVSIIR